LGPVSQTFTSWNPLTNWLRQGERLRDTDTLGNRLKGMRIEVDAVVKALETSCLKLRKDRRTE